MRHGNRGMCDQKMIGRIENIPSMYKRLQCVVKHQRYEVCKIKNRSAILKIHFYPISSCNKWRYYIIHIVPYPNQKAPNSTQTILVWRSGCLYSKMKQVTLMMITVGCYFFVGYSTARYLLVEIVDGVEGRGFEGNLYSFYIQYCNKTFLFYLYR